jgi:uncharacterized membrane protein YjfL (UPF0719 family)
MGIELHALGRTALNVVAYGALGMLLFGVAVWLVAKSVPFSLKKEIADDQNVSVGVALGAVILGVALILAAVVRG